MESTEAECNMIDLVSEHCCRRVQQDRLSKRVAEYFTAMFRVKAFLHWYTGEGRDEMEVTEAESDMIDAKCMACATVPRHVPHLTAAALFRGRMSTKEVDEQLLNLPKELILFRRVDLHHHQGERVRHVSEMGFNMAAAFARSSTAIQEMFKLVTRYFTAMFRRKAFLHW